MRALRPPTVYATESAVAIAPAVATPPTQVTGVPSTRATIVRTMSSAAETKNPAPNPASTPHIGEVRANRGFGMRRVKAAICGNSPSSPSSMAAYSGQVTLQIGSERDVLVLAKTIGANDFPVERPGVIAQDRASGNLLRLAPFPWKGADTDPPVQRWSWLQLSATPDERDPRPETHIVQGEILTTGYVDAKDGWRLRWPFVRPHLRGSVEAIVELSRARAATMGFVRPKQDIDIVQLPLRLRFRCDSDDCDTMHELPVLDWELHSLAQATRTKYGPSWATKFRETWGAPLAERYDVHLLLSAYAQAPTKLYVAGLFYPPKVAEDAHEHVHHIEHRRHVG